MKRVISNAYKQYVKSRPNPSSESIKRIKALDLNALGYHPLFGLLFKIHTRVGTIIN